MDTDSYNNLNNAVNAVFFDGRYQSLPVYLDLEDDICAEISSILGINEDELDTLVGIIVSETLRWDDTNIYSYHLDNLKAWIRNQDGSKPPFTALLVALSLAAERMRQGENYSSTNYYQRLAEILDVSDQGMKDKIAQAGKQTRIFWKALNRWLMVNDHELGRPTAKQVNSWTYVSYALSQALVRDADRKRFHRMFIEYNLTPEDKLTESEILLYLNEWMASSGPSSWLKKIWMITDLRERVADAAKNELDSWDGVIPGNVTMPKRLHWVAEFHLFPKKRVKLYLTTSTTSATRNKELVLSSDSSGVAREAVVNCEKLWFSEMLGTNLSYLDPISHLKLGALMLARLKLSDVNSQDYMHDARAIIPMVKPDGFTVYKEVMRISLHARHMLICHVGLVESVKDFLEQYARPGFTILGTNDIGGLPRDWVIFQGVEVLGIPGEEVHDNLQCLVPLSEGANVHFLGGLKLSHGIWHAKAPPEVYVSDENGLLDLQLRIDDMSQKGKEVYSQQAESYNPNFLDSVDISLDDENLFIVGLKNNRKKTERDISFRSAQFPRKASRLGSVELLYYFDDRGGCKRGLSAQPIEVAEGDVLKLTGMVFSGDFLPLGKDTHPSDFSAVDIVHAHESNLENYNTDTIKSGAANCIIRGYHVSVVGEDNKSMRCKDCGFFQLLKKRKRTNHRVHQNIHQGVRGHVSSIEENTLRVSPDVAYDALCYQGSGNWNSLNSIVSEVVDDPRGVKAITANLVDQGLIDVMLDDTCNRPTRWSCPSPSLVVTYDEHVFLSGFRNDRLIQDVEDVLTGMGCNKIEVDFENSPSGYIWKLENADMDELEIIALDITDPHGRYLQVVNSPAEAIISGMPSIDKIMNFLNPIHVSERDDIQRFNVMTGRWEKCRLADAGAYRSTFAGTRYFYHDGKKSLEGSFELIKLLAARDENIRLHGFNKEADSFECVLGCQPPGLYKRALVSCSGRLPTIEGNKMIYHAVPENLAAHLLHKLYN